jgi:hypothetical protein
VADAHDNERVTPRTSGAKANGRKSAPLDETAALRDEFGGGRRRGKGEDGPLFRFQAGLVEYGAERARQSGALEPRKEDIDALVEHAGAMARDAHRPIYAPDVNANDRLREDRFERTSARRRSVAEAQEHAERSLRESEMEQARVPKPGPKPEVPLLLIAGAVLVLSLTVAGTLRDFMLGWVDDDAMAWAVSVLLALAFGVFIAYSALSTSEAADRGRAVVAGGIIFALGLGVWRASGAAGASDYFTAAALTALEIGVIVILEWTGKRHEGACARWIARTYDRETADASVAAATSDLERRRTELAKLEETIEEHLEYVEDRTFRSLAIEELAETAKTAVRDGYNSGVAENRGKTRGPRR